jgi:hypothetical protein
MNPTRRKIKKKKVGCLEAVSFKEDNLKDFFAVSQKMWTVSTTKITTILIRKF